MIRLRALVALLALLLFPVFVLALLAGAVWTVVLLAGNNHSSLPAVKFLVIPLLFAVYWAVKDVRRLAASPVDGPSVSRDDQPRLWAEIDRLAQVAQTEPPARLVVVPDVNAAVTEVAGRREMLIGLPLLAGTSVGQLRSVLAHELGHFAGGDTEAAAKTYRWAMLLHRVRDNASGPVRWLLSLYVWFFTRASAASNRDVERAADGFSVRVAGAPTAAASIRRMAELDVAWSVLNDRYVPLFEAAGARAPLHTGMRSLLEANQEPIAEAVAERLATERRRGDDTHPTMRERIAAFEARGAVDATAPEGSEEAEGADGDLPATSLLDDPDAWLSRVEGGLLVAELPLASWEDVVQRAGAQSAAVSAGEIVNHLVAQGAAEGRDLGSALSVLERDDRPFGSWFARGSAEQVDAEAHEVLDVLVESALVGAGAARHQVNWSGPWVLVDSNGSAVDTSALVHEALTGPGGASRLREWLVGRGVDLSTHGIGGVELRPRLLAATTLMVGPWEGRRDGYVWSTGLLFVEPGDEATRIPGAQSRNRQQERIGRTAAETLETLRARSGSIWIPLEDVTAARVRGLVDPKVDLRLTDGSLAEIRGKVDSESFEEPMDALRALFADRLVDAKP